MIRCGLLLGAALLVACSATDGPAQGLRCVDLPPPNLGNVVALERVFANVEVEDGVDLVLQPGDASRWYLASKPGVVYTFTSDSEAAVFVDISEQVDDEAGEAGLLAIAFHPRFADNGQVFVSYNTPGGTRFLSRVSRFVSPDGGLTLDPASETEVLTVDQPFSNHNGGDIAFGPDGYLYFGLGDGGAGSDPQGNGQNTDTLLGSMLRIDVDVDPADGYAIPPDNPFVGGGGRPEIFAYGLRNPWRFSFDRVGGELWAGDVGQNLWEEVDVVRLGGNYGWNVTEGVGCFGADACDNAALAQPVVEYRNDGAASVVGGYVYRGKALPELVGSYIYSDYYQGTVWAVREGEPARVLNRGDARSIAAWTEDADGELLGVRFGGGIFRLVAAPEHSGPELPTVVSETGCINPGAAEEPPPGGLGYDVTVPFWSDGADKNRFAVLPEGGSIGVDADGELELPTGSVLVKSFSREGVLIETRLLIRHDTGWAGYSYAWREDGSDADLVLGGRDRDDWIFPDTAACQYCHTAAAGRTLGLELGQLAVGDQLDRFVEQGWLASPPPVTPLPGADAPAADRARAYLHVNCAQCHRPEGPQGRADLDLLFSTALADTGLCAEPRAGAVDLPSPAIVAPGAPGSSVLLARMRSRGASRMPPVGSLAVDEDGAALIEAWVASLAACD